MRWAIWWHLSAYDTFNNTCLDYNRYLQERGDFNVSQVCLQEANEMACDSSPPRLTKSGFNTINQAAVRASIHRVPPSPEACTEPGGPSNRIQRSQAPTNDSQKDKTLGLVRRREHPSISEKNSFSSAFVAQDLSFPICIYPHLRACLRCNSDIWLKFCLQALLLVSSWTLCI